MLPGFHINKFFESFSSFFFLLFLQNRQPSWRRHFYFLELKTVFREKECILSVLGSFLQYFRLLVFLCFNPHKNRYDLELKLILPTGNGEEPYSPLNCGVCLSVIFDLTDGWPGPGAAQGKITERFPSGFRNRSTN